MRTVAIVCVGVAALLCEGCVGACCTARPCAPAQRCFLVLRGTQLDAKDAVEGSAPQILLESRAVIVPGTGRVPALRSAQPLEAGGASAWLAGAEVSDASFGPRAETVAKPSIVATDGQEGTVFVGERGPTVTPATGWELKARPHVAESGLRLVLSYVVRRNGAVTWRLPSTTVHVPEQRVLILEVPPAR